MHHSKGICIFSTTHFDEVSIPAALGRLKPEISSAVDEAIEVNYVCSIDICVYLFPLGGYKSFSAVYNDAMPMMAAMGAVDRN
jgi:hypothetical protein